MWQTVVEGLSMLLSLYFILKLLWVQEYERIMHTLS